MLEEQGEADLGHIDLTLVPGNWYPASTHRLWKHPPAKKSLGHRDLLSVISDPASAIRGPTGVVLGGTLK